MISTMLLCQREEVHLGNMSASICGFHTVPHWNSTAESDFDHYIPHLPNHSDFPFKELAYASTAYAISCSQSLIKISVSPAAWLFFILLWEFSTESSSPLPSLQSASSPNLASERLYIASSTIPRYSKGYSSSLSSTSPLSYSSSSTPRY